MNLRRFKRKLGKHQTIASIVIGLIVTMLIWLFITWQYAVPTWEYVSAPIIFCGLAMCLAALAPLSSYYFLRFHRWLGSRTFQKAIDSKQFSFWAVMPTSGILNFTFFTFAFWLPYSVLCNLFPPMKAVEPFIPTSYQELIQRIGQMSKGSMLDVLVIFALAVSFGPTIVFIVRRLREDGQDNENRGQGLFLFLQVLFYISVFIPLLAFLSWRSGIITYDFTAYFIQYRNTLLLILLPGSIGGGSLLAILEGIKQKLPYVA